MNSDVAPLVEVSKLPSYQVGEIAVQRDMELVRKIFRAAIERSDVKARLLTIDGYDPEVVGVHIAMLFDAGYIQGIPTQTMADRYKKVLIQNLTWEGHEFAGALLVDESVWGKVKSALSDEQLRLLPFETLKAVTISAVTAWTTSKLGL